MKGIPFDRVEAGEWDAMCDVSSQAWLFHRTAWVKIETHYFFPDNYSFALHDGHRFVAAQPLYRASLGLGSWNEVLLHCGVHRHTGLALVDGLDASTARAARSVAMRHISEIAALIDADRIQLNSQNLAPQNLGALRSEIPFWVSDYGYFLGLGIGPNGMAPAPGLATCCADQIVALQQPAENLFSQLDESCRRAVRKAQVAGLEWCEGDDAPVADYYKLAEMSSARTGESLAPRLYYEDVWRAFGAKGLCKIIFVLSEGRKVAALWLLVHKGAAHFLGGVSDPEYLPMRVNDFLHWSAIVWANHQGLKHYRLGPVFPELPDDWPVARVSRFKGKFGGTSYSTIQGSYFRHPEKYLETGRAQLSTLVSLTRKGG
jgi:hypothetical protein